MKKKNWSLLVKPTEDCNLNCQYCYAKPFREMYPGKKMSFEMIEKILTLSENYAEAVNWIWHGGEPTMMGIEWYERVQELFYKHSNAKFNQSMQSNGLLLDEKWSKLSQNYGIDIGVSYDVFDQEIRVGSNMQKIEDNLKRYINAGGSLGTITVINKKNYKRQIELYEYFKNVLHISPAFNHVYRSDGTLDFNLEITSDDYAKEFANFYKYWINDTSKEAVEERSAVSMTRQVIGNRQLVCTHSDCRNCWVGVNPIGVLYPCDRYIPERYSMGNIMDYNNIEDIYNANGHRLYSMEIHERFKTHCKDCGYYNYCQGGCNANHISVAGNASGIDEFSCELFKKQFNEIYKVLRNVDIYKNKYNFNFLKLLIEEPFLTLNEITEFLAFKNLKIEEEPNLHGKELFKSKEFKLLRLFNPFKGDINGHTNYSQPQFSINIMYDDNLDINSIKETRFKILDKIFERSIDKIMEIMRE